MLYLSCLWEEKGRSHESLNNVRLKVICWGKKLYLRDFHLLFMGFVFCFCFLRTNIRGKILYLFLGLVKRKEERPDKNRKLKELFLTFENQ